MGNNPINWVDPSGKVSRKGWKQGKIKNNSKDPVKVRDLDTGEECEVDPGETSPEGTDWDEVDFGDQTEKIGPGKSEIDENGEFVSGFLRGVDKFFRPERYQGYPKSIR